MILIFQLIKKVQIFGLNKKLIGYKEIIENSKNQKEIDKAKEIDNSYQRLLNNF